MYSINVTSLKELEEAGKKLLETFPGQNVFAFYGKMGAGKTTFIQAICRALGSNDYITSPTFAIINEYTSGDLSPIYHFDFYRIKDVEEAFDLGYEDYLYSKNYCFIEWPEMIEPILPEKMVEIKLEALDDNTRIISANLLDNKQ